MAWPPSVFRELAAGRVGVEKSRKAVGPSDGKMNGAPVTTAASDIRAIDSTPLTKANSAITDVESWRRVSDSTEARSASPYTSSEKLPPIGPGPAGLTAAA